MTATATKQRGRMPIELVTMFCLFTVSPAAYSGWAWGQYYTPAKVITEADKFTVVFNEGTPNPNGCAVPGGGVVIRRDVVGQEFYRELYSLFTVALTIHGRVELAISTDCNFGPNVVAASLSP